MSRDAQGNGSGVCVCDQCDDETRTSTSAVCGSDSRTYHSLCQLQRAACLARSSVHLAHEGACSLSGEQFNSNGVDTIRRLCDAETARGLCSDQELCFETFSANNGTSKWACECADCDEDGDEDGAEDEDEEKDDVKQAAGAGPTPAQGEGMGGETSGGWVCGSDGNSYRSECLLRRHSCRSKTSVELLYIGRCRE